MLMKNRFNWNEVAIGRLKELLIIGLNNVEAADILSEEFRSAITPIAVSNIRNRYVPLDSLIETDSGVPLYNEPTIPLDDCMVSCDYHGPYYSELYINRLLILAEKFGIKTNIIVGDTFDMDFAKYALYRQMKRWGEQDSRLDTEVEKCRPMIRALNYFDKNYLIAGNHEARIDRMTQGKIGISHLLQVFWGDGYKEKVKFTVYDKLRIGDDFLVVHPASYSQISGSVAVRLAEKYHRHVLNAHGHFIALRFDRSGQYMGIDLGGMFNKEKVEYINKKTTTHPLWNNGFGMIYNGKFYHFHDESDWDYWLN